MKIFQHIFLVLALCTISGQYHAARAQLHLEPVQLDIGGGARVPISKNIGRCLDAAARNAVISSGQVLGLKTVMLVNGISANSKVRGVRLCRRGSGFVYQFTEIKKDGTIVRHILSAS